MKTTKKLNEGFLADTTNRVPAETAPAAAQSTVEKKDSRLPIDAEARKQNRTLPTPKVLELLKTSNPGLFNLAEFVGVVEVGHVNHALEIVVLGEPGDDLVDLVTDFLVTFERHHVRKTAALGHVEQITFLARRLVRHIFHEQQDEDVILVLRGVHAAAQLIAALPERAVKFGFFYGHNCLLVRECARENLQRQSVFNGLPDMEVLLA